jgi:amino acid transporter
MINMVGIGPFITLPLILIVFPGKFSIIPWIAGAVISLADVFVWSELGAAYPSAGGSYVFLQKIYRGKLGKMLAFLYSLQTSLHTPLVITSAAIGFANYFGYLVPLNSWQTKLVMVTLVLIVVIMLYRKIGDVGKIGLVLSVVVVGMLLWTIATGGVDFSVSLLKSNSGTFAGTSNFFHQAWWFVIGSYTSKTLYAYLGYYNVCSIGSEIKRPEKNIPRSIIISIVVIAVLYILMQLAVAGALPASTVANENSPIISLLFEKVYGKNIARVATVMVLAVAASSLFAVLLGYSRVIYAAACDGMHFKIFSHLHSTKKFPDYTLLTFGGVAIIFCLIFSRPSVLFSFIVATRIFIQFIPQAIGVILFRVRKRTGELKFKMPLYPVIPVFSILMWAFVFFTSGQKYFLTGIGVIIVGIIIYFIGFNKK